MTITIWLGPLILIKDIFARGKLHGKDRAFFSVVHGDIYIEHELAWDTPYQSYLFMTSIQ